jgi:hypothetical protein
VSYGLVQGPLPIKSGVDYSDIQWGRGHAVCGHTFLPKITAPAALRIATQAASSDGLPPAAFVE